MPVSQRARSTENEFHSNSLHTDVQGARKKEERERRGKEKEGFNSGIESYERRIE
jgi:hypothetical protein